MASPSSFRSCIRFIIHLVHQTPSPLSLAISLLLSRLHSPYHGLPSVSSLLIRRTNWPFLHLGAALLPHRLTATLKPICSLSIATTTTIRCGCIHRAKSIDQGPISCTIFHFATFASTSCSFPTAFLRISTPAAHLASASKFARSILQSSSSPTSISTAPGFLLSGFSGSTVFFLSSRPFVLLHFFSCCPCPLFPSPSRSTLVSFLLPPIIHRGLALSAGRREDGGLVNWLAGWLAAENNGRWQSAA